MLRTKKWLPFFAGILAWVLVAPGSARADFLITITGGGVFAGGGTVLDGDDGNVDGSIVHTALAVDASANVALLLIRATSSPLTGGPALATITLDIDIMNNVPGVTGPFTFNMPATLVVTVSNDMLTMPVGGGDFDTSGSLTRNLGNAAGTADWTSTADGTPLELLGFQVNPGDNQNDNKHTFGDLDTYVGSPNPMSGVLTLTSAVVPNGGPNLTFQGASQVRGEVVLQAVPAPGGLALALTTLPAVAFGGWMRRRKRTPSLDSTSS